MVCSLADHCFFLTSALYDMDPCADEITFVPQLNRVEDAVIRYLNRKPANEGSGGGAGGS
jgi:hypothetical protein